MENLQNFITETKAKFEKIDISVAELQERKKSIECELEKNYGYSLENVKSETEARQELQQVTEAIERALVERYRMTADIDKTTLETLRNETVKTLQAANQNYIDDVEKSAVAIRKAYYKLNNRNAELSHAIKKAFDELKPYTSTSFSPLFHVLGMPSSTHNPLIQTLQKHYSRGDRF